MLASYLARQHVLWGHRELHHEVVVSLLQYSESPSDIDVFFARQPSRTSLHGKGEGSVANFGQNQVWPSCFTIFGQTIFGQHQLWPYEVWPTPTLAKPSLASTNFGQNLNQLWPAPTLAKTLTNFGQTKFDQHQNLVFKFGGGPVREGVRVGA